MEQQKLEEILFKYISEYQGNPITDEQKERVRELAFSNKTVIYEPGSKDLEMLFLIHECLEREERKIKMLRGLVCKK